MLLFLGTLALVLTDEGLFSCCWVFVFVFFVLVFVLVTFVLVVFVLVTFVSEVLACVAFRVG